MKLPAKAMVTATLAAAVLTGCQTSGDQKRPADDAPPSAASPPCLLTAQQLTDITGTEQEIREPDEYDTRFECQNLLDGRGALIRWGLRETSLNPPPTLQELRGRAEQNGSVVEEVTLGKGIVGWLARGTPVGLPEGSVIALFDGRLLDVTVRGTGLGGEDVPVDEVAENALAVAQAFVSASESTQE